MHSMNNLMGVRITLEIIASDIFGLARDMHFLSVLPQSCMHAAAYFCEAFECLNNA